MVKVRVRADQIQKGDVLFGHVVLLIRSLDEWLIPAIRLSNEQAEIIATLPLDAVVEVERPEPTLTVTIELTPDEARYAASYGTPPIASRQGNVVRKVGAAVRAAKEES